jgi:hypothetical protein
MAVTGSVPVNETAIATENIAGEKTIEGMTIVDEHRLEITVHLPLPMVTLIKLRMTQTEKKASEYQCTNRMNHLSCLSFCQEFLLHAVPVRRLQLHPHKLHRKLLRSKSQ